MMGKESACQAGNTGSIPGLGRSNSSLEEEMAIHSSSLDWRILWTEKPGRLQFTGSQGVRHSLATKPPKQMILVKLGSHLKIKVGAISHTLYQDEFQMDQRFKCIKKKERTRQTMGELERQNRKGHSTRKPKSHKRLI